MARISRDNLFIRAAHLWSMRSTCPRGSVGAVIVRDRRIISTGYNGSPPGMPHCEVVGCEVDPMEELARIGASISSQEFVSLGCQRTIHAEANAVAFAAQAGIATDGAKIYCTHSPCKKCAQLLSSAGIVEVVFNRKYRLTPWDLLEELGIKLTSVPLGVIDGD